MPKIFNGANQNKAGKKGETDSGHKRQIPPVDSHTVKAGQENVIFQSKKSEVSQPSTQEPVGDDFQQPVSTPIDNSAQQTENDPIKNLAQHSETLNSEPITKNPFKSYAPKPSKIRFSSQLKDEKIVLMLRKHPATQIGKIVIVFIFFLIPILLLMSPAFDPIHNRLKLAAVVGWYAMLLTYSFEAFLLWFYHVFFITNKRVIDVDFVSLLHRKISFAKIGRIEDVTTATTGFLASMLNYGTVYIQTAASAPQLQFEKVPQPEKVSKVLKELMYVYKRLRYGLKMSK